MILFGLKTIAFLDVWSVEHILSGISIAAFCFGVINRSLPEILHSRRKEIFATLLLVLCITFFWEMTEHYLEEGLLGEKVAYWFQGVEHWSNRLISDNLMIVLGMFIYLRFPHTLYPMRFLSLIWLVVHVFIFPHSMYLHELF